jgi:uncharacterized protein (TIGR00645 family)
MSTEGEPSYAMRLRRSAEYWLEAILFSSRWLLAPLYLGLVLALVVVLYAFFGEFVREISHIGSLTAEGAILLALALVDLSLVGGLILIVIFAGYENFVSKMDLAGHEDRPAWMGTVDFGGVKLKLVGSIVAISAISLLRAFMKLGDGAINETELKWRVILHLTFVSSGVLLALMDLLSARAHKH